MTGFSPPPSSLRPLPTDDPLARIRRALRLVTVPFPYLAGLAASARVGLDERVPTMGVFASGRMVANASFVSRLNDTDLRFVVAHELLHLALRTHQRAVGSDRMQFNVAHDYIINDLLRAELGIVHIPAGGLDMPGARLRSAEEILMELRRRAREQQDGSGAARTRLWAPGEPGSGDSPPGGDGEPEDGDVLADAVEREWFGEDRETQRERQRAAGEAARRGGELARALGRLPGTLAAGMGLAAGGLSADVDARRGAWRAPASLALQRGLEAAMTGARTFERASRRAGAAPDAVLPGRRRDSRLLNLVLDTSGSMTDALPSALGAIADACDALGIDTVRLVQCDAQVTRDDTIDPRALTRQRIDGFGGSDLSPALQRLAADPTVLAVVVLTDGDVLVPADAPPFDLLWLLPPRANPFSRPPYGRVLHLSTPEDRP
jgi:hypothetical protein